MFFVPKIIGRCSSTRVTYRVLKYSIDISSSCQLQGGSKQTEIGIK